MATEEEIGVGEADVRMLLDGLEVGSIRELRDLVGVARERRVTDDRLFVNEDRTVLCRLWANGTVEVAQRSEPDHTWGPPVYLIEEGLAVWR